MHADCGQEKNQKHQGRCAGKHKAAQHQQGRNDTDTGHNELDGIVGIFVAEALEQTEYHEKPPVPVGGQSNCL